MGPTLRTLSLFSVVLVTAAWVAVQDVTAKATAAADTFRIWGGLIGMAGVAIGGMGLVFYAWALAKTKALAGAEKTAEIYKDQLDAADRREANHKKDHDRLVDFIATKDAELALLRGRTDLTKVVELMQAAMEGGDRKYVQVTDALSRILTHLDSQGRETLTEMHQNRELLNNLIERASQLAGRLGSVERRVGEVQDVVEAVAEQNGAPFERDENADDRRQGGR